MFSSEYPRLQLEVFFSDQDNISASDIQVNVPQWGIRLRFQPLSQRLYLIDIHNFNVAISFNINGYIIRDKAQATTFSQLQKALGPTFPGRFIDDGQYLLTFDGVGFLFRVPREFQTHYSDGKMLPIILPDKTSAELERVYVHGREFDMQHPELCPDVLPVTARIVLQCKRSPADPLLAAWYTFSPPPPPHFLPRGPKRERQAGHGAGAGGGARCAELLESRHDPAGRRLHTGHSRPGLSLSPAC
jgi:hypothetical protein